LLKQLCDPPTPRSVFLDREHLREQALLEVEVVLRALTLP
jgi:hypothetical protein